MTDLEKRKKVVSLILNWMSGPALYENLAEELIEAAHAALKAAQVLRKENPTPVTAQEAGKKLKEELYDVFAVLDVIGLDHDEMDFSIGQKLQRWCDRIEAEDMQKKEPE